MKRELDNGSILVLWFLKGQIQSVLVSGCKVARVWATWGHSNHFIHQYCQHYPEKSENRCHRHSRAKAMCCSISFFFQDFFRNRSLNQGITSTFKPYSLTNIIYYCIYTESRKMVPKILCAVLQRRQRCKEKMFGLSWRRRGWDDLREEQWNIYTAPCKTDSQWEFDAWWHPKLVLCDDLEEWGRERSQGEEFGRWRRDTCMPMVDSCWCMAKTITIL